MNPSVYQQVSSAPVESERRRDPRFSVQVQIELHEEGTDIPIRGETADLSRGGCYLQLTLTLALGACLRGRVWLGDSVVCFRGRVVTLHPQFGNGIVFVEFEGDGDQVLASYLEKLPV
ncbi:MAG: PilZ domain-containing protein [Terriglobales bacterium]